MRLVRKLGMVAASGAFAMWSLAVIASPAQAAGGSCSVGVGHTAVWAKCTGSGSARLQYWCKSWTGNTWTLNTTAWYKLPVTISRECAHEAADPSYDWRA